MGAAMFLKNAWYVAAWSHEIEVNALNRLAFETRGGTQARRFAYDANGEVLATRDYYSVGGGFVLNQDEAAEDRIVPGAAIRRVGAMAAMQGVAAAAADQ